MKIMLLISRIGSRVHVVVGIICKLFKRRFLPDTSYLIDSLEDFSTICILI